MPSADESTDHFWQAFPLRNQYFAYGAIAHYVQIALHLHGFEDNECLPLVELVPRADQYLDDLSGHRGNNRILLAQLIFSA